MGKTYHKSWGNLSYEIVDEEAYGRYWWGRKPSTRKAFEEWLGDPDRSQRSIEKEYGRRYNFIRLKMADLVELGIIRRFKREA